MAGSAFFFDGLQDSWLVWSECCRWTLSFACSDVRAKPGEGSAVNTEAVLESLQGHRVVNNIISGRKVK